MQAAEVGVEEGGRTACGREISSWVGYPGISSSGCLTSKIVDNVATSTNKQMPDSTSGTKWKIGRMYVNLVFVERA